MDFPLPLSGVRVLELGTVIAGPFAGSLLADLGAEVIKVEAPGKGDVQRAAGYKKNGVALWWGVASRDKKCITLDLKHARGKALLEQLIRQSDVLVENYRPGVLDRLGFGWDAVHAMNPRLTMLSISGYGKTGLGASRPGFGKVAEAYSGIVNLTGSPDDKPLFVGFSLADASTGLFGALGVALALFHRDAQGGEGSHIDAGLYEGLFRMLDCQLAVQDSTGKPAQRLGTNDPYGWGLRPAGRPLFQSVRCRGGEWFLLRISEPERVRSLIDHGAAATELPILLEQWAANQDAGVLGAALANAGVEIAPVLDGTSMAADEYLLARGDVLPASHPGIGEFHVPGPVYPATTNDPRRAFHDAGLGEHTEDVLRELLGLGAADIEQLRSESVI